MHAHFRHQPINIHFTYCPIIPVSGPAAASTKHYKKRDKHPDFAQMVVFEAVEHHYGHEASTGDMPCSRSCPSQSEKSVKSGKSRKTKVNELVFSYVQSSNIRIYPNVQVWGSRYCPLVAQQYWCRNIQTIYATSSWWWTATSLQKSFKLIYSVQCMYRWKNMNEECGLLKFYTIIP